MPDDISHSSGHHWTHQTQVSQHTSTASGEFPSLPTPPVLRVVVADDNPVVRAGLTVLLSGRDDIEVVAEAGDGREAYDATVRLRPDVVLLDVRMPGVDGISALPHLVRLAPVLMMTYSRESAIVHEALRLGAGGYLVHGEFTADQLVAAVRDIRQGRPHFTPTAAGALLATVRDGTPPQGAGPLPDGLGAAFTASQPPSAPAHPSPESPSHDAVREPQLSAQRFAEKPSLSQANVAHSSPGVLTELSQREVEVMDLIASGLTNQQIAATCFISQKTVKNHINRIFAKLNATSRGEAIAIWHGVRRGGPA
ncbi:response regulator transcription factor [Streptomyces sp. NRRL S-118]|uniref:response regulator transcription factor n=1 Tax=Streptomyces sp. NRRL S-118 TaxID=1463881 RepID=UPI0004CBA959|nr:response regulator transcription factor [Streptomyces sp. NRRL S-118]